MFVPPDQRSIPPRWEPPRENPEAGLRTDAATWLVVLVAVQAMLAPVGGGVVVVMAMMWVERR